MCFVVVNIGLDMNDVKHIPLERTPFQVLVHFLYSLFRRFVHYQKEILDNLVLLDNGMLIGDSFIPYEYLVTVTTDNMILLAREHKGKLTPADNLVKVRLRLSFRFRETSSPTDTTNRSSSSSAK